MTEELATVTGARRALGKLLAAFRGAAGLTQQDLGRAVNLSRSSVANVEAGRQHIDRRYWEQLDTLLNSHGELLVAYGEVGELLRRGHADAAEAARRGRRALLSQLRASQDRLSAPMGEDADLAHSVIRRAFSGVSEHFSGPGDPLGATDFERRVVEAYRQHDRQTDALLSLVLVGGFAGSGKSEFARFLSSVTGWTILDKDTITRPLVEQLLLSIGCDVNDRQTPEYRTKVRPHEYRCLLGAGLENLECKISTVLTAPFLAELADMSWLQRVHNRCSRHSAMLTVVWVKCDTGSMYDYIAYRGAARDAWKLANWDEYLATIDPGFEPTFPHYTVDNRLNAAVALADQARELALRVQRAT
jgi:transcriptional regulator with XRE-family HTH domain/predicted kinase